MRLIPSKTLVRHAEDSTSPAPSGSWLNYWSETLGIEIPQYGTKHSLNVSVTTGIVLWEFAKRMMAF